MKLVSVQFSGSPLEYLGNVLRVRINDPEDRFRGFRVAVRGPVVYLVSPPGWRQGQPLHTFKKNGPVRAWEVPRAHCQLMFDEMASIEEIDKLQNLTSDVAEKRVPPEEEPELTESELEAATAPPKAVRR